MKFATILLGLAALVFGYIAFRGSGTEVEAWDHPTNEHLSGVVPDGHEVLRFHVDGMCCDSCPTKLRAWLADVDGVVESAVSFADSRVEAVVPADFDPAPILSALNQDKYTAQVEP